VVVGLSLLLSASLNRAAIRINGNQMVESAITYHRDASLRASPAAIDCLAVIPEKLVTNLGQGVSGGASGSGTSKMGVGLGYDIGHVAYGVFGFVCPVAMTGDVNLSSSLTSADIIYLVNFVFKGQADPLPCEASGDVNCSRSVTSADIIYMVNHVFKGQPPPLDVCGLVEAGTLDCPW
jgi:hypothetical protein